MAAPSMYATKIRPTDYTPDLQSRYHQNIIEWWQGLVDGNRQLTEQPGRTLGQNIIPDAIGSLPNPQEALRNAMPEPAVNQAMGMGSIYTDPYVAPFLYPAMWAANILKDPIKAVTQHPMQTLGIPAIMAAMHLGGQGAQRFLSPISDEGVDRRMGIVQGAAKVGSYMLPEKVKELLPQQVRYAAATLAGTGGVRKFTPSSPTTVNAALAARTSTQLGELALQWQAHPQFASSEHFNGNGYDHPLTQLIQDYVNKQDADHVISSTGKAALVGGVNGLAHFLDQNPEIAKKTKNGEVTFGILPDYKLIPEKDGVKSDFSTIGSAFVMAHPDGTRQIVDDYRFWPKAMATSQQSRLNMFRGVTARAENEQQTGDHRSDKTLTTQLGNFGLLAGLSGPDIEGLLARYGKPFSVVSDVLKQPKPK